MSFEMPWGNYALKELVETQAPEVISWWPQTLAWKLILVLVIMFTLSKIYKLYVNYQRNAYRRDAIAWITKLPSYSANSPEAAFRQLPALLRHTAIMGYGREKVSLLSNEAWESWLDEQCSRSEFSSKYSKLLHQLAYAPTIDIPPLEMQNLVKQITLWVKFHRSQYD